MLLRSSWEIVKQNVKILWSLDMCSSNSFSWCHNFIWSTFPITKPTPHPCVDKRRFVQAAEVQLATEHCPYFRPVGPAEVAKGKCWLPQNNHDTVSLSFKTTSNYLPSHPKESSSLKPFTKLNISNKKKLHFGGFAIGGRRLKPTHFYVYDSNIIQWKVMEHNATNMSLPSFAFNRASYNSMDNYHGAFFEST